MHWEAEQRREEGGRVKYPAATEKVYSLPAKLKGSILGVAGEWGGVGGHLPVFFTRTLHNKNTLGAPDRLSRLSV